VVPSARTAIGTFLRSLVTIRQLNRLLLQATLGSLVKAFVTGQLEFPMTEAEWGVVMTRIETVAQHFDSAYRDIVLNAFRAPSQRLRFQPPVLSFATESIEIEIGVPMDVSPLRAFEKAEPIIIAVPNKGKAHAIEPTSEEEQKEEEKIWEMKLFDSELHVEINPGVSGVH